MSDPNTALPFDSDLRELRAACETAVSAGQNATTLQGVIRRGEIVMSLVVGGIPVDTHLAETLAETASETGDPVTPENFADELNRRLVEDAISIIGNFVDFDGLLGLTETHPDQPEPLFHVVGRLATSSYADDPEVGHTEVYEIYRGSPADPTPILTITGVHRRDQTDTNETVLLFSSGDEIDATYYNQVSASREDNYARVVDMFGDDTLATALFAGHVTDTARLDRNIANILRATLATGIHPEEDVREVLAIVRAEALVSLAPRPELTQGRIRSLSAFALSLRLFTN